MTRTTAPAVLEFKRFPALVKASKTTPGEFEAIVSVFGNIDSYGDRMIPGAFSRSLSERGLPPIYWNHAWSLGPIGDATDAKEIDEGLWVRGQLWLDAGSDLVARVYRSMLGPARTEFSFAYATRSYRFTEEDGRQIRELLDVELYEVGPVTVGANDQTELIRVASALGAKHGTAPRYLQEAHDALVRAGAKCSPAGDDTDADPDDDKASRDTPATLRHELLALLTKREHEEGIPA